MNTLKRFKHPADVFRHAAYLIGNFASYTSVNEALEVASADKAVKWVTQRFFAWLFFEQSRGMQLWLEVQIANTEREWQVLALLFAAEYMESM